MTNLDSDIQDKIIYEEGWKIARVIDPCGKLFPGASMSYDTSTGVCLARTKLINTGWVANDIDSDAFNDLSEELLSLDGSTLNEMSKSLRSMISGLKFVSFDVVSSLSSEDELESVINGKVKISDLYNEFKSDNSDGSWIPDELLSYEDRDDWYRYPLPRAYVNTANRFGKYDTSSEEWRSTVIEFCKFADCKDTGPYLKDFFFLTDINGNRHPYNSVHCMTERSRFCAMSVMKWVPNAPGSIINCQNKSIMTKSIDPISYVHYNWGGGSSSCSGSTSAVL